MAQKINVPMPADLDLATNFTVRITAVDSSGAAVTAVKAGPVNIIAQALTGGDLSSGAFALISGPGA